MSEKAKRVLKTGLQLERGLPYEFKVYRAFAHHPSAAKAV
jgi:hypothetical protein